MLAIITIFSTFALNRGRYPGGGQRRLPQTVPLPRPDSQPRGCEPLGSEGARPARGGVCRSRLWRGHAPRPSRAASDAPLPLPLPGGPPGPCFPQPLRPARLRGSGARAGRSSGRRGSALPRELPLPSGVQVCFRGSAGGAAGRRSGGSVNPASPGLRPPRPPSPLGILGCPDGRKVGAGEPAPHFDSSRAL